MKIEIKKPVTQVLHIASGLPGKSAYQVAVDEGETLPVNEWLASLEGASVETGNGPPVDAGRKVSQPYLDADTGDIYSWSGSAWTLVGNIASVVPGPANTLTIGTVTEGAMPAASITGASPNQTLDLTLKTGAPGPANTLAIGTVVEGPAAGATITGASPSQTLNLVLPEADPGPPNTLTAGTITQIPAGGQPTFSITGTAPAQTLNLGLVDGTPTAFELRGEGFPGTGSNATSTNAASPGTYYTDTLGTNGAWRWLKTSAGTGTARWVVMHGDTGWRSLPLVPASLSPSNTGRVLARRRNDAVSIFIDDLLLDDSEASYTTLALLPEGFRPADRDRPRRQLSAVTRTANQNFMQVLSSASNYLRWEREVTVNSGTVTVSTARPPASISGPFGWAAPDAWPSTLPGTPG